VDVVVYSHVVIDDIVHADGRSTPGVLGGAGAYAAAGAALQLGPGEARVGIVAGIGADLDTDVLARHGVSADGLHATDPLTPRTLVRYHPDGERTETSQHGDAHFARANPWPSDTPPDWAPRSVYAFRDLDERFWAELDDRLRQHPAFVLWELHAGVCTPELRAAVLERVGRVDAVSLNRAEARALLGEGDASSWARTLLAAGTGAVALRLGAEGALLATPDVLLRAAPPPGAAVDPTGAGNAFSGALVAALGAGLDPSEALRAAMAAAACTISDYGPPPTDPVGRRRYTEHLDLVAIARETPIPLPPRP